MKSLDYDDMRYLPMPTVWNMFYMFVNVVMCDFSLYNSDE